MKILLLGLNYAPEEVGIGPYTTGLAEALVRAGHSVDVVAGKPYYPEWQSRPGPRGLEFRVEQGVRVFRVPHYVPARPNGLSRMLHYLSFAANAWPVMRRNAREQRPDLVVAIAPALIAATVALAAARKASAKTWLHIQDFEVEAALATGILSSGPIARLALAFERTVIGRFDRVSTISPTMAGKVMAMGTCPSTTHELRNWAEIDGVHPALDGSRLRAELAVPEGRVVLYSGNLAMKQGIGLIADAARRLAHRKDLHFLVCGDGSGREAFARHIAGLGNVHLRPLQPRDRLGELLAIADVHVLPQIAGAATAVLPSKLTNMLASGRPVVATAEAGTALAQEVEGCGLVTPPGDAEALATAIEVLAYDPGKRRHLGAAAREQAVARWSREALLSDFVTALENA